MQKQKYNNTKIQETLTLFHKQSTGMSPLMYIYDCVCIYHRRGRESFIKIKTLVEDFDKEIFNFFLKRQSCFVSTKNRKRTLRMSELAFRPNIRPVIQILQYKNRGQDCDGGINVFNDCAPFFFLFFFSLLNICILQGIFCIIRILGKM